MQIDANDVELQLARKLFWLMKHEYIFFSSYNEETETYDDGTYPAINCNDICVPGADAEPLLLEDIDLYIDLCQKYPVFPEYAWCIAKRNQLPWRNASTEYEKLAVAYACQLLNVDNPLEQDQSVENHEKR